jgi:hypothetical protein
VPLNLPNGHATGLQEQVLVVKANPAGLILGPDLRLKAGMSVTGEVDGQLTKAAFERLFAFAVGGVASGVGNAGFLGVAQVLGHLGLQGMLDQALGQLLEQVVYSDEVFRLFVASEELVVQFVTYGYVSSFLMFGSFLPYYRLHKIEDILKN